MKKIFTPIFMIAVLMLTSCKKSYVCYCTDTTSGQKMEMQRFKPSLIRPVNNTVEKKELKDYCSDLNSSGIYGGTYTNCEMVKE